MTLTRQAALSSAKKLCRTISSAPLPQARTQAIFSELTRAEGWSGSQARAIVAFGEWLAERPPPSGLKARCEALLAQLA